ncbi:MAG: 2-dehydropantoate 2-reductase [Planctomycetota bacterium]|nr:MAG: 2-dehydropantoate 2-reductase [Planctomycetota bacterium]
MAAEPISVVIAGAGALGRALGALLCHGGARVCLLGRGQRATAAHGPADLVLLTAKSYDTEAALAAAAAAVGERTVVATLQNGLGNAERIAARFGGERTAAGATTHAAQRTSGGAVLHTARGPTALAPWAPAGRARLAEVVEALGRAGLQVVLEDDPVRLLWRKLVVASGILPVTALLGLPNGALAVPGPAQELALAAAAEAARVAEASGIMLDLDPSRALIEVAQRTAANRSSMLQDLQARRRTEIDAIAGAVVAAAGRSGVAAEIQRALWLLVRARERADEQGGAATGAAAPLPGGQA